MLIGRYSCTMDTVGSFEMLLSVGQTAGRPIAEYLDLKQQCSF